MNIHLLHLIIIVPIFFYISLINYPHWVYNIILLFGLITLTYHIYLQIMYNKSIKLFHIFIVSPLLIYIGYMKPNKNNIAYQLILLLAFSALGYHTMKLINFT